MAELLNNMNVLDGTLLCPTTFGVEKKKTLSSTFLLSKAGPFTLGNHICVKAFKMQGFPNK